MAVGLDEIPCPGHLGRALDVIEKLPFALLVEPTDALPRFERSQLAARLRAHPFELRRLLALLIGACPRFGLFGATFAELQFAFSQAGAGRLGGLVGRGLRPARADESCLDALGRLIRVVELSLRIAPFIDLGNRGQGKAEGENGDR